MNKTIAQQLNIKKFPFTVEDSQGNRVYYENSYGDWEKQEYDSQGNEIYFEDSYGTIIDNRPTCNGKIVDIEGKKYKLEELDS